MSIKIRSFEELKGQIEAYLDSVTAEELALQLIRHGVEFESPPKYKVEDCYGKIHEFSTYKEAANYVYKEVGSALNFKLDVN